MPAKYVEAFLKGHKNDYRDAQAIAEAVQRPTMRFVATKTAEQLDLQALHRVRARLVGERTAAVNEIRAFLLERGVAVAKGIGACACAVPKQSSTGGAPSSARFPSAETHICELCSYRPLSRGKSVRLPTA